MKTISLNLYNYAELEPKAKKRALSDWRESADDPMLQAHLGNLIKEELDARHIKYDTDSINCLYSLSHSQGDGLMFEGILYDENDRTITIKHEGHYYHEYSKNIDYPEASEREYADFDKTYTEICKKIAQAGYDEIDFQTSEEYFAEMCEANDYTFEADGEMRNV